jgi:hypothetical protein
MHLRPHLSLGETVNAKEIKEMLREVELFEWWFKNSPDNQSWDDFKKEKP